MYLGVVDQSGELIVAMDDGVIKVRDIVRMTDPNERWNIETFNKLVTNPMWQPNPGVQDHEVHINVRVPREEDPITPIIDDDQDRREHRFPIRA